MNDKVQISLAALGLFLLCDNLGILRAIRHVISSYIGA